MNVWAQYRGDDTNLLQRVWDREEFMFAAGARAGALRETEIQNCINNATPYIIFWTAIIYQRCGVQYVCGQLQPTTDKAEY